MRWSRGSAQGLLMIIATEKSKGRKHVKQVIDEKFETSDNLYNEAQKFRKEYFKEDPSNKKKNKALEKETDSPKNQKKDSSKIKRKTGDKKSNKQLKQKEFGSKGKDNKTSSS